MATKAQRERRARQRKRQAARRKQANNTQQPMRKATKPRNRRRKQNRLFQEAGAFLGGMAGGALDGVLGLKNGGSVPLASNTVMRSNQTMTSVEQGNEQIATLNIPADTAHGAIVYHSAISPTEIGIRLQQFARLWTMSRFLDLVITVVPQAPTTVGGGYIVAIDPDVTTVYSGGPELENRLSNLGVMAKSNAWAPVTIRMNRNDYWLYNQFRSEGASDAELRQHACGQLIIATTGQYTDLVSMSVYCHWQVSFSRPENTIGGAGPTPTPDDVSLLVQSGTRPVSGYEQDKQEIYVSWRPDQPPNWITASHTLWKAKVGDILPFTTTPIAALMLGDKQIVLLRTVGLVVNVVDAAGYVTRANFIFQCASEFTPAGPITSYSFKYTTPQLLVFTPTSVSPPGKSAIFHYSPLFRLMRPKMVLQNEHYINESLVKAQQKRDARQVASLVNRMRAVKLAERVLAESIVPVSDESGSLEPSAPTDLSQLNLLDLDTDLIEGYLQDQLPPISDSEF